MARRAGQAGSRLRTAAALLAAAAPRFGPVEDELAVLPRLVRPGDVCLDVGAKHGAYALVLAAASGPAGRVVAFEPLPGPRRVLRVGRRLLGAGVEVVPAAVAAAPGRAELLLPVRRGRSVPGRTFLADGSVGLGSNAEFRRHRRVPADVTTLDAWWTASAEGRVDVVKIDVEGAEAAVLRGGERMLRARRPILLIELEDRHLDRFGTSAGAILDGLVAAGYRAAVLADGRWREVGAPSTAQRNHLLVPAERWDAVGAASRPTS